ncbi:DNA cytosine methyltransferase [Streptomyces sp. NPDC059491]|uniref:DNA cytosine methyltransferase n=1 Tax=Streptomyces sp. NPDC059491 TaxID=3346850 RepID=UPI0036CFDE41
MPRPEIVDLFAGPGGLDVAARDLGYEVTGIEFDQDACDTRAEAGLLTLQGDVRDFGPHKFPNATVLAGGPPCQTFTVAGSGAGRRALDEVIGFVRRMARGEDVRSKLAVLDDDRTGLVLEPLRWALEALRDDRPYEAIVLEQVPAVLPVWEEYARVLSANGYWVAKPKVLHTEQFGVPQTRRRAILVARRNRMAELPEPTHRLYRKGVPQDQGDPDLKPWVSMAEVLDRPTPFEVVSNYGTGGDPRSRGRRTSGEPAFTVTGKVSRNRVVAADGRELPRFSAHEAGVLQTFPRDYPWSGRAISQQVGNAIPPLLGKAVLTAALGTAKEYASESEDRAGGQR